MEHLNCAKRRCYGLFFFSELFGHLMQFPYNKHTHKTIDNTSIMDILLSMSFSFLKSMYIDMHSSLTCYHQHMNFAKVLQANINNQPSLWRSFTTNTTLLKIVSIEGDCKSIATRKAHTLSNC